MRRRLVVIAVAVLGLVVAAIARPGRSAAPVYSVAQVIAGLSRSPGAWSGRTIDVRGRAVIPLCGGAAPCRPPGAALLADLRQPGSQIRLTWTQVNPLLSILLHVPYIGAGAAGRVGGVGVYRVRLIRSTLVVPANNLPGYFPYTSKTVVAYDDQALLVNGLN